MMRVFVIIWLSVAQSIAQNAGVEGAVVVGELLKKTEPKWGYNAQIGEYQDMFEAGIIDPTKVRYSPKILRMLDSIGC